MLRSWAIGSLTFLSLVGPPRNMEFSDYLQVCLASSLPECLINVFQPESLFQGSREQCQSIFTKTVKCQVPLWICTLMTNQDALMNLFGWTSPRA